MYTKTYQPLHFDILKIFSGKARSVLPVLWFFKEVNFPLYMYIEYIEETAICCTIRKDRNIFDEQTTYNVNPIVAQVYGQPF